MSDDGLHEHITARIRAIQVAEEAVSRGQQAIAVQQASLARAVKHKLLGRPELLGGWDEFVDQVTRNMPPVPVVHRAAEGLERRAIDLEQLILQYKQKLRALQSREEKVALREEAVAVQERLLEDRKQEHYDRMAAVEEKEGAMTRAAKELMGQERELGSLAEAVEAKQREITATRDSIEQREREKADADRLKALTTFFVEAGTQVAPQLQDAECDAKPLETLVSSKPAAVPEKTQFNHSRSSSAATPPLLPLQAERSNTIEDDYLDDAVRACAEGDAFHPDDDVADNFGVVGGGSRVGGVNPVPRVKQTGAGQRETLSWTQQKELKEREEVVQEREDAIALLGRYVVEQRRNVDRGLAELKIRVDAVAELEARFRAFGLDPSGDQSATLMGSRDFELSSVHPLLR